MLENYLGGGEGKMVACLGEMRAKAHVRLIKTDVGDLR